MSDFGGRTTRNFRQDHRDGVCLPNSRGYCPCPLEVAEPDSADLVCSDLQPPFAGFHKPVIDLDLPCRLVPSGTPGHFHLYIDHVVPLDQYVAMLEAMAHAGVVQYGFLDSTRARGYGSVRHPERPKAPAPSPFVGL